MKLLGERNWYLPGWLQWLPRLEPEEPSHGRRPRIDAAGVPIRGSAILALDRPVGYGAAPESNRPSVGLPRLTDFEDFQRNQLLAGENLRATAVRASLRAGPRFRLGRAYAAPTSR
jgi:hypothetical protein